MPWQIIIAFFHNFSFVADSFQTSPEVKMMMSSITKHVPALLFWGVLCTIPFATYGGERNSQGTENGTIVASQLNDQFQWSEHKTLTWDDFRGPVNAATGNEAAATNCGIGIRTKANGDRPVVVVYNTFYAKKSWVHANAKIQSILTHEQGHFDMCELYTRILRARIEKFDDQTRNFRDAIMAIYAEVSNAYETRQQAYEAETIHGTDTGEQKRWQEMIANELKETTENNNRLVPDIHA